MSESRIFYLVHDQAKSNAKQAIDDPMYAGWTVDKEKARKHFDSINKNPYSTGKVTCVTDTKLINRMWDDDWNKL